MRIGRAWVRLSESGENGQVTAPGPHAPPTSRRAAREPRDDSGAPETQVDAAGFSTSGGTWDDLPDWVGAAASTASPARHRSNYVPAPAQSAISAGTTVGTATEARATATRSRPDPSRAPRARVRGGCPPGTAGEPPSGAPDHHRPDPPRGARHRAARVRRRPGPASAHPTGGMDPGGIRSRGRRRTADRRHDGCHRGRHHAAQDDRRRFHRRRARSRSASRVGGGDSRAVVVRGSGARRRLRESRVRRRDRRRATMRRRSRSPEAPSRSGPRWRQARRPASRSTTRRTSGCS